MLSWDRARTWSGWNFYHSNETDTAYLIDMEGRILHRWRVPGEKWFHCELLADGGLVVMEEDVSISRITASSEVVWRRDLMVHHDLARSPDGRLLVLAHELRVLPALHPTREVLDDLVVTLDLDGEELDRFSLLELLLDSPYADLLPDEEKINRRLTPPGRPFPLDLMHTNHIQLLDAFLAAASPLFDEGQILLTMRNIDFLAALSPDHSRVVWGWTEPRLHNIHHGNLLPNGRILLFHNGRKASEILELDPSSGTVPWRYGAGNSFFSTFQGSNQRLANGNTLITESNRGRVREVTRDGEIVWQFANPDVVRGKRRFIWRMTRIPAGSVPIPEDGSAPSPL